MNQTHRSLAWVVVLGCVLPASSSYAFTLREHKEITRVAIQELAKCWPDFASVKEERRLVFFDKMEDLDLFRKELFYSHYYDPDRNMPRHRKDASARITSLQDNENKLGSALHYLQDMASPPHVVPVSHGFSDGFEGLVETLDINEVINCQEFANEPTPSLLSLLIETKNTTQQTLSQNITVLIDGVSGQVSWASFFVGKYAKYGPLGNNFGRESFTIEAHHYIFQKIDYEIYKQQLLRLAVSVTRRAIYHYLIEPEINEQPSKEVAI